MGDPGGRGPENCRTPGARSGSSGRAPCEGEAMNMAVRVVRRRKGIEARYPGAAVVDVTSRGPEPWVRFSPFYPHGGIPVPYSPGVESESVEGIWQALKVFR